MTVHFDGGQNTIGIVGLSSDLVPVFAYGACDEKYHTNNVAECQAALKAVQLAVEFEWAEHFDYIKFVGDS